MSTLFILTMPYGGIGPAIYFRNRRRRLIEEQRKLIEEIKEIKKQTQEIKEQTRKIKEQTYDLTRFNEDISRRLDVQEIRYGIKKR